MIQFLSIIFLTLFSTIYSNHEFNDLSENVNQKVVEAREAEPTWKSFRLNENVIPIKYWLEFNIDVTDNRFDGKAGIDVEIKEEVEYIIVHASESLNITDTRVKISGTDSELSVNQTFRYIPYEFYVIQMSAKLKANKYRLDFRFESELNQDFHGLYKSQYTKDGQPIGLVATQFQDIHARKAFPCFDEPTFKTRYEVTITSAKDMSLTITNTPLRRRAVNEDNTQTLSFEETPPMSTYLLALTVSDFVCRATRVDGYDLRVCASNVSAHKLDYSFDISPKILHYFGKEYLKTDYTLSKVDLVAVPGGGSMENWGLIMFGEGTMLWDDSDQSSSKINIASTIGHECAHMWFGDLVTMNWWSDIWLNEGFANFMSYKAVDAVHKDWHYSELFLTVDYIQALMIDSLAFSVPMVRPVTSPEELPFRSLQSGVIVYQKGATILRMIEHVMGSEPFRLGLQQYLKKHEYQSVVTTQLWDALNTTFPEKHNTTIYELMDTWTTKAGLPYLTITRDKSVPNRLTVRQDRFLANGENMDNDTVWTVPLSYYSSLDTKTVNIEFIKSKEQTIDLIQSSDELLKLNVDNQGFYLVNYPEEDWNKWTKALVNNENEVLEKLTPSDRTNLLIDSFYLSGAGLLSIVKPLELSKYLSKENHSMPWTFAIISFAPIQRYLSTTEYKRDLDLYLNGLAQPIYDVLGWDDTQGNDIEKRFRTVIIDFICGNNYEPCLRKAHELYSQWKTRGKSAPNLLLSTLKYGIKGTNVSSDWDYMWNMYSNSSSQTLKFTYLYALSMTSNTELIKLLLDRSLNDTSEQTPTIYTTLFALADNPKALDLVWHYYRTNYLVLNRYLNPFQLGNIVNTIANYFSDETKRNELNDFFKRNPKGVTEVDRKKALETVDSNMKWIDSNKALVGDWLKDINAFDRLKRK